MRHPLLWHYGFKARGRHIVPPREGQPAAATATTPPSKRRSNSTRTPPLLVSNSGSGLTPHPCQFSGDAKCAHIWLDVWGRAVGDLAALPPAWRWAVLRFEVTTVFASTWAHGASLSPKFVFLSLTYRTSRASFFAGAVAVSARRPLPATLTRPCSSPCLASASTRRSFHSSESSSGKQAGLSSPGSSTRSREPAVASGRV